jgi:16S rRNA (cytosine967-C5)-methyltransferase
VAVERHPQRARALQATSARMHAGNVTVVTADAKAFDGAGRFDRVLLDPPCSDLGALASRPDARWRKSPAAIERLVEVQAELLRGALEALRPGGTLVYSTCTISRRENEDQVSGGLQIQLRPDRDRTTGFFICRMSRDDGGDE